MKSAITLTALGAVLNGYSTRPVFSALPASMPVGLWDDSQDLIVSATVSASDPIVGHFNYKQVPPTQLYPGVTYTIASLVPKGWAVLSDVPAMTPGSEVTYGAVKSLASQTLAFPPDDAIGLRKNYFGASFTYTGATDPVALAGADQNAAAGETVTLDGSASFSPRNVSLTYQWTLVLAPKGSSAVLAAPNSVTPSLTIDRAGVYVAQLICSDGSVNSVPSTVSVFAEDARRRPVK